MVAFGGSVRARVSRWWKGKSKAYRFWVRFVIISSVIVFSLFDFSDELTPVCSNETYGGRPWKYCVTETAGSESQDLLYYFHGFLESEKGWTRGVGLHLRKDIREVWKKTGYPAPKVVTFSMGRGYFLTPLELDRQKERHMTVDQFVKVILPYLESTVAPGFKGRRILLGLSMGGYNALQVYLHSPELWSKTVLLNPLVLKCDPFAPFFSRLGCTLKTFPNLILKTMGSFTLIRDHFGTSEVWKAMEPLTSAEQKLTTVHSPIMIQIGTRDDFGFYPGARELANVFRRKGHFAHYVENTNFWHDTVDVDALAEFLRESSSDLPAGIRQQP